MASMAIAVPKLRRVGLSCTKTGVEIAAKLILLQNDVTINSYVAPLIEGPARLSWECPTRYAHTQLLLALSTAFR